MYLKGFSRFGIKGFGHSSKLTQVATRYLLEGFLTPILRRSILLSGLETPPTRVF